MRIVKMYMLPLILARRLPRVCAPCANKKRITFNKAGLKCNYKLGVKQWIKDEAEFMGISNVSKGYVL